MGEQAMIAESDAESGQDAEHQKHDHLKEVDPVIV
jgi:hypothetical protein